MSRKPVPGYPGLLWRRIPGPPGAPGVSHALETTAGEPLLVVRHCGHPTALYRYYIQLPNGRVRVDESGRAFKYLVEAKEAALALVWVELGSFPLEGVDP